MNANILTLSNRIVENCQSATNSIDNYQYKYNQHSNILLLWDVLLIMIILSIVLNDMVSSIP